MLVGNWFNCRLEAESPGWPWVKLEAGATSTFVTSIGNHFWTREPSPFDFVGASGQLVSSGDTATADFGRTVTPLPAISSRFTAISTTPFNISAGWDDFHVDTEAIGSDAAVMLPPCRAPRKLTVTHAHGTDLHLVRLHPAEADRIAGLTSVELAVFDSIALECSTVGQWQWLVSSWSSVTARRVAEPEGGGQGSEWLQVAPGKWAQVMDKPAGLL